MHELSGQLARRVGRRGFTLVELLLVMFVMSALVALVVGVGSWVIDQGRIKETHGKQDRLLRAIDVYRKITGKVPPDRQDTNNDGKIDEQDAYEPAQSIEALLRYVQPTGGASLQKTIYEETLPYLSQGGTGYRMDAFNTQMRYYTSRGLGGKPLIVSAGPDGQFGDGTTREAKEQRKDNVRSDTKD